MSERRMRGNVVRWLRKRHAFAVENPAFPGTPDVYYVAGWIELKHRREWPPNPLSIVRIPHFTQVQRTWLRMHWEAGGAAHLLLQVGRDWLLFDGPTAARVVGRAPQQSLRDAAVAVFFGSKEVREGLGCHLSRSDR